MPTFKTIVTYFKELLIMILKYYFYNLVSKYLIFK